MDRLDYASNWNYAMSDVSPWETIYFDDNSPIAPVTGEVKKYIEQSFGFCEGQVDVFTSQTLDRTDVDILREIYMFQNIYPDTPLYIGQLRLFLGVQPPLGESAMLDRVLKLVSTQIACTNECLLVKGHAIDGFDVDNLYVRGNGCLGGFAEDYIAVEIEKHCNAPEEKRDEEGNEEE